jgi:hypothetical protein
LKFILHKLRIYVKERVGDYRMEIPDVYKSIRVESMYWDNMTKRFPKDQFREEDVEYERNEENVDSMYIVITKPTWRNTRRMVYWRWGPEAKFYHHLQALYQVIEGGEGMPKPYMEQLGILWEKCKKERTRFQGIGRKRYPNDEREDLERLEKRYQKVKDYISSLMQNPNPIFKTFVMSKLQPNILFLLNTNDVESLIENRENEEELFVYIFNLIYTQRGNVYLRELRTILSEGDGKYVGQLMEIKNNKQIITKRDRWNFNMIELFLILYDIHHFQIKKLLSIDYIVAFILKSYDQIMMDQNIKGEFKILLLKSNDPVYTNKYSNKRLKRYPILRYQEYSNLFKIFLRDNMEYLNGTRNNIQEDNFLPRIQPIRVDFQKRSVMKYFYEKYKKELQEINPVLEFYLKTSEQKGGIYALKYSYFYLYLDSLFSIKEKLKQIASLSKNDRKIIEELLKMGKTPNIYEPIEMYFHGEKIYISYQNLPIVLYLLKYKKQQNTFETLAPPIQNRMKNPDIIKNELIQRASQPLRKRR